MSRGTAVAALSLAIPMPASTPTAPAPTPHGAFRLSSQSINNLWDESIAWLMSHAIQVAIALAIGAVLVAGMLALRSLGRRLCRQRHTALNHWPQTIGRAVAQTQIWFIVLFAGRLVDGYADPPPLLAQTITALFTVASALQGAIWVRELILGVVEHRAGGESHAALSSAIGIIRLLVTVVLYAIALVLILDNLGVNVTGLIAGLGIGGIAIGLAAKGIFDDLFSALSIIFDRPFGRGDAIRWDNTNGTVEAIGLKTTRVRSVTGEEVVISNTNLLNKELHNLARLEKRRIINTLSIAAYTSAEECARVPGIIQSVIEAQDKCKLVRCGLVNFGPSSLDFELQYDVYSELYDVVFDARHMIWLSLLRAFEREKIDWAWPTSASIPASADGRPVGAAPVRPQAKEDAPASSVPPARATSREIAPD